MAFPPLFDPRAAQRVPIQNIPLAPPPAPPPPAPITPPIPITPTITQPGSGRIVSFPPGVPITDVPRPQAQRPLAPPLRPLRVPPGAGAIGIIGKILGPIGTAITAFQIYQAGCESGLLPSAICPFNRPTQPQSNTVTEVRGLKPSTLYRVTIDVFWTIPSSTGDVPNRDTVTYDALGPEIYLTTVTSANSQSVFLVDFNGGRSRNVVGGKTAAGTIVRVVEVSNNQNVALVPTIAPGDLSNPLPLLPPAPQPVPVPVPLPQPVPTLQPQVQPQPSPFPSPQPGSQPSPLINPDPGGNPFPPPFPSPSPNPDTPQPQPAPQPNSPPAPPAPTPPPLPVIPPIPFPFPIAPPAPVPVPSQPPAQLPETDPRERQVPPPVPPPPPSDCSPCAATTQQTTARLERMIYEIQQQQIADGLVLRMIQTAQQGHIQLDTAGHATNAGLGTANLTNTATTIERLGGQIANGGIAGLMIRTFAFLQIDRVLNVLTYMAVIHNALQLSNSIKDTLFSAVTNILATFGLQDEKGQPLDAAEIVNMWLLNFANTLFGAENVAAFNLQWKKWNRVYQAGANILSSIQSIQSSMFEALETIGSWIAIIGNSLKASGAVSEKLYKWLTPNPNFRQNKWMKYLDQTEEFVSQIENVTSETLNITQTTQELTGQKAEFDKAIAEATEKPQIENMPKASQEAANKASSQSPDVPVAALDNPNGF